MTAFHVNVFALTKILTTILSQDPPPPHSYNTHTLSNCCILILV